MSNIKPAMTPEEWDNPRLRLGGIVNNHALTDNDDPGLSHAVAAWCLFCQPFGFTWEMVDALRLCAFDTEASRTDEAWELAEAAVERVASLLPPREGA